MKTHASRIFILVFLLCGWSRSAGADAVTDWNENAGEAAQAAGFSPDNNPLHESRMYAMVHIAIHDALNAIDRRSRPYVVDSQAPSGASPDAAVAAAARDVLVALIKQPLNPDFLAALRPAGLASVEADYTAALGAIAAGEAKTQGIDVGQEAAAAVLALRANDGSGTLLIDTGYTQGTAAGEWRFTPGFDFAFAPGWADVTPFVLKDAAQFRPGPPYKLTGQKYAADVNEVKSLGVKTGSTRTADQTQIALFWVESSPLSWNRLARMVSAAEGLDLWENARLFGLLNMAMADGYIGSFEAKYLYNYWRPVTAIRLADTDGNPDTTADPAWEPLVPTPPVPDYDAGHAVQGGAAAQVLKRFFKDDEVSFSACSLSSPLPEEERCGGAAEVRRSFTSFTQAAEENGVSRIYNGFHFRDAVRKGIKHGRKIGNRAVNLFLKPVD
jgi:hypothetical protein